MQHITFLSKTTKGGMFNTQGVYLKTKLESPPNYFPELRNFTVKKPEDE